MLAFHTDWIFHRILYLFPGLVMAYRSFINLFLIIRVYQKYFLFIFIDIYDNVHFI